MLRIVSLVRVTACVAALCLAGVSADAQVKNKQLASTPTAPAAPAPEKKAHRLVLQVDSADLKSLLQIVDRVLPGRRLGRRGPREPQRQGHQSGTHRQSTAN